VCRRPNLDGSVDTDKFHGGEDVVLNAIGAGSDAVSGVIEQNRVFDIKMKAFGWIPITTYQSNRLR